VLTLVLLTGFVGLGLVKYTSYDDGDESLQGNTNNGDGENPEEDEADAILRRFKRGLFSRNQQPMPQYPQGKPLDKYIYVNSEALELIPNTDT
jgi:hypothetical protein